MSEDAEANEPIYEMQVKNTVKMPSNDKMRNVEEKEVQYTVLQQGEDGRMRSHNEVSPWGAAMHDGQLTTQHDRTTAMSPYARDDDQKDRSAFAQQSPQHEEQDESDTDTTSTETEDWLNEQKVHWEWNPCQLSTVAILAVVLITGIGIYAATTPSEPHGDEYPRGAHLLSTSHAHSGHLSLGKGHPDDILETIMWVGGHALEGRAPSMVVNVSVEATLNETDPSSWVMIDPETEPRMVVVEEKGDAKKYKFEMHGPNDEKMYARMTFATDEEEPLNFAVHVVQMHAVGEYRVLFAALVLMFEYTLIVFELVDRTLAAMIGSFVSLVVLGVVKERPDLHTVINWIDFETVLLLFGMMIMVRIFSLTGVFEWCAVRAYKLSGGDLWKLTWILCTFTAVTSAFLDNVTTMLLLTPVTCRLCKILKLDPTILLLAEVMFSNIGGTATAVGDPPNIIIVNDNEIASRGIEFAEFTLHMMLGSIMVFCVTMPFMKWRVKDWLEAGGVEKEESLPEDEEERSRLEAEAKKQRKINLRNSFVQENAPEGVGGEILEGMSYEEQEKHTYARNHPKWNLIEMREEQDQVMVSAFHVKVSVDHYKHNVNNDLLKRILIDNIQKMESEIRVSELSGAVQLERTFAQTEKEGFEEVVQKMEANYKVRYHNMFFSVGMVLVVVILFFFIHSAVHDIQLNLAWIAVLGAIVALTVSGIDEPEKHVLSHVEWGTLLFFAALFVLMEALTELGLIDWLGDRISEMINAVDGETEQMIVAIIVLLWVSAFASAFIDNIPYTTAMVPVVVNVADSTGLSLKPMVFALAFGTCLGGNGTLIGASANVVTVGIAKEAYGNEISFVQFMKFGLPVMVVTISVASVYLVIVHPIMGWNM